MLHLDPLELRRHADVLVLDRAAIITVRFAGPGDADALQAYFRGLSARSRYNRLMGAASELPARELARFVRGGDEDGASLVLTAQRDGAETIIGEARYALDDETRRVEIGLSVDDAMQGQGIGAGLLGNLDCRAATIGASVLFGDTLRTNDAMIALARKSGFSLVPTPGDWKQVRFEKPVARTGELPCANRKSAALTVMSSPP